MREETKNIRQQLDYMRDVITDWVEADTAAGYAYAAIMFGKLVKTWSETITELETDAYEKRPPKAKA